MTGQHNPYPPQPGPGPYGAPGQPYGSPPADPRRQFGPPPPGRKSKAWIWITIGSVMAVVLLFTGGAFALNYVHKQDAEHDAALDDKLNPVKRKLVDALVADHTKALKDRDLKAFLAPFDPADKKLIAAQTRVFQNLIKIPFSEATFADRSMRGVTPLGSGFTFDLQIGFIHKIGEYDRAPVERRYFWKVVQDQKNGPLKITSVDRIPAGYGATDVDFYPTPWDKWNSIHVEKTKHTVLIVDGSLRAEARRHAADLEAAAAKNLTAWKASGVAGDVPSGFVVSLVNGTKELGSLWRVTKKPPTEAGVSIGMPATKLDASNDTLNAPAIGGSRVVIDIKSGFFDGRVSDGPAKVFRHELAHSLMAALTVAQENWADNELTTWVVEGFAEYVAHSPKSWTSSDRIPDAKRQLRKDDGKAVLPSNGIWDMESRIGYHYLLGHSVMGYIAEKYGEEKVYQLVTNHYRGEKNQIQELLGVPQGQFERDWAAYFTGKLG